MDRMFFYFFGFHVNVLTMVIHIFAKIILINRRISVFTHTNAYMLYIYIYNSFCNHLFFHTETPCILLKYLLYNIICM